MYHVPLALQCIYGRSDEGVLKVNAGKSKGMVLGGEEGLEYEVCIDEIHLEHVSKFKYLGCVLDKAGIDEG